MKQKKTIIVANIYSHIISLTVSSLGILNLNDDGISSYLQSTSPNPLQLFHNTVYFILRSFLTVHCYCYL